MGFCIEEVNGFLLGRNAKPDDLFLSRLEKLGWRRGQFIGYDRNSDKLILFDSRADFMIYKKISSAKIIGKIEIKTGTSLAGFRSEHSNIIDYINSIIQGKSRKPPALMKKLRMLGWKEGQFVYFDEDLLFFDTYDEMHEYLVSRSERIIRSAKGAMNWKTYSKIEMGPEINF